MQVSQGKTSQSSVHKNSTPQSDLLEIERDFHAPVNRLFEAFTTSEALKTWWWPKGLYADRVDVDFREGGRYFINMKGFDQGDGGMTGRFEEIIKNQRIVMTDRFSDAEGNAISAQEAKMPGVWPEVVYITFDFNPIDENTSHFKLSQQGIPNEMQKECVQGWNESLDKLEKFLNWPL